MVLEKLKVGVVVVVVVVVVAVVAQQDQWRHLTVATDLQRVNSICVCLFPLK